MMYLLVLQPKMMSAVAGIGQIRICDTAAETKKFFAGKGLGADEQREACTATGRGGGPQQVGAV